MESKIIIKKYANRRLYNTKTKEYINLQDIANLIKEGHKIEVLENQTQKDITQETLVQVMMAEIKDGENIFPVEILHKMIKVKNDYLKEFLEFYFASILDSFIQFKKSWQNNFGLWWQMPSNFPHVFSNKEEEHKKEKNDNISLKEIKPILDEYKSKIEKLENILKEKNNK